MSSHSVQQNPEIFDRRRVKLHRERAAAGFGAHDFLVRHVAAHLADRLEDVTRTFPRTLILGCHGGAVAETIGKRFGIERLVQADLALGMVRRAGKSVLVCDEERLPFSAECFDLVLCAWNLHWVNDLVGTLIQLRRILRPDGLLLAVLPGAASLWELREATFAAAAGGGLAPRISPFVEVREAGNLLMRAGFALPMADSDLLQVSYSDPYQLMQDLRGMGERNALLRQFKGLTTPAMMTRIAEAYALAHRDEGGRISATFELLTLTGWKPHDSQPKAAKRGSGEISLSKIFNDN